jgi:hypothetical protein
MREYVPVLRRHGVVVLGVGCALALALLALGGALHSSVLAVVGFVLIWATLLAAFRIRFPESRQDLVQRVVIGAAVIPICVVLAKIL